MSKPYSRDDLAEQLSRDITWRVREISDLKTAIRSADDVAKTALLRATLAICYAHWEGHVRFSATKYLSHVALRKLPYADLAPQFLRNEFLPRLASEHNKSVKQRGDTIDLILNASTKRFSRVNEDLVSTRSNLNYEVLEDICRVCDVDPAPFKDKADFIDIILLKRRNAIAHGENALVNEDEIDNLTDSTIDIMRMFSNHLQSNAYLGSYRSNAMTVAATF